MPLHRRKTTSRGPDLPLMPLDPLGRRIQKALDLMKPDAEVDEGRPEYDGYCGAACEAYLYLAGGRSSGLKVKRSANRDGSTHWWLEGAKGIIDLTLSARDRRERLDGDIKPHPYRDGRGAMFRNGYERPSRRARAILTLVDEMG